jgi:N-acylneuraminate cytidylyltransferase
LLDESLITANRQSLPQAYTPNGAIYIFPAERFLELGRFPIVGSYPLIMSQDESIDIDSVEDLHRANIILGSNYD